MHLENTFTVPLPLADAWDVLLDIERIAPCMPGAELQEVEGEEYRGLVKLRLGAVTTQFKGVMQLEDVDREAGRIVMKAQGRDTRGQGNANATITARLSAADGGTKVDIDTDLAITGKLAQFGRGVMGDVSKRLLDQFVTCLEAEVTGATGGAEGPVAAKPLAATPSTPAPTEGGTVADAPAARPPTGASGAAVATAVAEAPAEPMAGPAGPRTITSRPAEPVDVLGLAGGSVMERALPAATVGLLFLVAMVRDARRRWAAAALGAGLVALATRWQRQQRD